MAKNHREPTQSSQPLKNSRAKNKRRKKLQTTENFHLSSCTTATFDQDISKCSIYLEKPPQHMASKRGKPSHKATHKTRKNKFWALGSGCSTVKEKPKPEPKPKPKPKNANRAGGISDSRAERPTPVAVRFFPQSFPSVTFAIDSRIELRFPRTVARETKSTAAFPFIRSCLCDNLKLRKF